MATEPVPDTVEWRPVKGVGKHIRLVQSAVDKALTLADYHDGAGGSTRGAFLHGIDALASDHMLYLIARLEDTVDAQGGDGEAGVRHRCRSHQRLPAGPRCGRRRRAHTLAS
jgi:hypothetical protein